METCYPGFLKAIDSVSHFLPDHKLLSFGIVGSARLWARQFPSKCSFNVRVGSYKFGSKDAKIGTPQNSTTGSFLFLLFISDLAQ